MSTKQENDKLSPNLPANVTPFPYPYYPTATEDDTIDLVELILTIWRYWWLILSSVVFCLVAAGIFLQITPKSYSSTTIYEAYESSNNDVESSRNTERTINERLIGLFATRDFIQNFLEQAGLTPLILRDLYDPSTDTYALPNDLLSPDEFAAASLIGNPKNPTFEFQTEKSSGLTSLTVHFRDPDLAVSLANDGLRWANDYLLSQEIVDLQRKLDSLGQSLSQLGAEKAIEVKSAEIETSFSVSPLVLENLQQRLIDRQIELGVLEKTQPSAASITEMKAEIGVLEAKLAELNKQRNGQSIGDDRQSEEISKLRIQFAQTQARLQLLQFGQQPLVRIIDRAIPPENPSKPNVRLILALSLVVGLFGGVFLVFLVDFVRKTRQRLSVNP
ncbi:MAG: Wzz/FepE/Etk N-terminal domain-containing protein [SAR324 cluster bacterium]|nr:Wzz/FepE/Etk N-terminal domain-containing protein [SAR324 cluster bacterium]